VPCLLNLVQTMNSINDTFAEDENAQLLYIANVNTKLLQAFSIILPLIGMPGNTIAVYILHRMAGKDSVSAVYIKSLCVFNMIGLIVGLPRSIAKGVYENNFIYSYLKYCTFSQWVICSLMSVTSWHIVLINGCRLITFFPSVKCANSYVSPHATIVLVCVVCAGSELLVILLGLSYFYPAYSEPGCYLSRASLWAYIHFLMYAALPFLTLASFNCILYYITWKRETLHSAGPEATAKRDLYLVIVLSSAHFMMTMFPTSFFYILPSSYFDFESAKGKSQSMLVYNISIVLLYSGNCTNYFFYTCLGKRFRKELLRLVAPLCPKSCPKGYLEKALAVSENDPDTEHFNEKSCEESRKKSRQSSMAKAIDVEDMNWRYDGSYRYTSSKSALTIGEFYSNLQPGRPGRLKSNDQRSSRVSGGSDSEDSSMKEWIGHRSTSVDITQERMKFLEESSNKILPGSKSSTPSDRSNRSSGPKTGPQTSDPTKPKDPHKTESLKTNVSVKSNG
ncbi:type-1 angiotensin II receptor B, partial [Biomphalaria pfeifferi]